MRRVALVVAALVVLAVVHRGIAARETLLEHGRTLILATAPVDPRAPLQGDYMQLAWQALRAAFPTRDDVAAAPRDGYLVLAVDARNVATFRRLDDGTPLAADEARMRYRIRDGRVRLATNAWFFEEGRARQYAGAHFGEFRADEHGDALLVALRDPDLLLLGTPIEGVTVARQPG
ncbi:MAG: GDYXXLXY domain-containing protein [Proteobacteria bacterium]|nr:GDYXXLXY domain-containing protein [Pseudomonadota bacterium]